MEWLNVILTAGIAIFAIVAQAKSDTRREPPPRYRTIVLTGDPRPIRRQIHDTGL